MSSQPTTVPRPGTARITLVLLAIVPALMANPWDTAARRWVLGLGLLAAIVLLGWWQGLHLTTIARRRIALGRSGVSITGPRGVYASAALRIAAGSAGAALPLPLIASYLDRYGLRADSVRITSRLRPADEAAVPTDTWISLTYSAISNLPALQARSTSIPLQQTVDIAARRLADHLREAGWDITVVTADEVPSPIETGGRETWQSVVDGSGRFVTAYRVAVDAALSDTLSRIRSAHAGCTWTALEFAEHDGQTTVAGVCALATDAAPEGGSPVGGLLREPGNQRRALLALYPLSGSRLDGHVAIPGDALEGLRWPVAAGVAAKA